MDAKKKRVRINRDQDRQKSTSKMYQDIYGNASEDPDIQEETYEETRSRPRCTCQPRTPSPNLRKRSSSWSGERIILPTIVPEAPKVQRPQVYVYQAGSRQPIIEVYPAQKKGDESWREAVMPDFPDMQGIPGVDNPMACLCRPGFPPRGYCKPVKGDGPKVETGKLVALPEVSKVNVVGAFYVAVQLLFLVIWYLLLNMFLEGKAAMMHYKIPPKAPDILNTFVCDSHTQDNPKRILINNPHTSPTLEVNLIGPFGGRRGNMDMYYQFERHYFRKGTLNRSYVEFKKAFDKEVKHSTFSHTVTEIITEAQTSKSKTLSQSKIRFQQDLRVRVFPKHDYSPYKANTIYYKYRFPPLELVPGRKNYHHIHIANKSVGGKYQYLRDDQLEVVYSLRMYVKQSGPRQGPKPPEKEEMEGAMPMDCVGFAIQFLSGVDHHFTTTEAYAEVPRVLQGTWLKYLFVYHGFILIQMSRATAAVATALTGFVVMASAGARPQESYVLQSLRLDYLCCVLFVMLLNAVISDTGVFDRLSILIAKNFPSFFKFMLLFTVITSLATMLFDSMIAILLVAPYVVRTIEEAGMDPKPVLIVLVIFSNITSALFFRTNFFGTVLIVRWQSLADSAFATLYAHFLMMLVPVAGSMVVTALYFGYYFGKNSPHEVENYDEFERKQEIKLWRRIQLAFPGYGIWRALHMEFASNVYDLQTETSPQEALPKKFRKIRELSLLQIVVETCVAYTLLILFWFFSAFGFQNMTGGGVCGMCALLLLTRANTKKFNILMQKIDWATLFMYAAFSLFGTSLIVMGLSEDITALVQKAVFKIEQEESKVFVSSLIILLITMFLVNIIGGVSAAPVLASVCVRAATAVSAQVGRQGAIIETMRPLTLAATAGITFGGLATVIGTPAAFACANFASQQGYNIGAWRYFRMAVATPGGPIAISIVVLILIVYIEAFYHVSYK